MSRRIKLGEAFESLRAEDDAGNEIRTVEFFDAQTRASESKTRGHLAYAVAGVTSVFLFGAAGIGCLDGTFDELQQVWNVGGVLVVGGLFGHYFSGNGKNGDKTKN